MSKRPVSEAYKSFVDSSNNSDVMRVLSESDVKSGWFGKPSRFEQLYQYAYENSSSEEECNSRVRDFILGEYKRGDVYTRSHMLERFKDENPPKEPPRSPTVTINQGEAMSRPGSGADKGITGQSGKGLLTQDDLLQREAEEKYRELLKNPQMSIKIGNLASVGRMNGWPAFDAKSVFIEAYKKSRDTAQAGRDLDSFINVYTGNGPDSDRVRGMIGNSGSASAYSAWADKPAARSISAKEAEAMSRPGSGAAKGIGSESGVDILTQQKMADAEAKKNNKDNGWEITPDKSLSTSKDARAQAIIIKSITGVDIDPNNADDAYSAYKSIYDSGKMSDAMKCKQAAENLEYIYDNTKTLWVFRKNGIDKNEADLIEFYYKYASKIAKSEDGWFGKDRFGVDKEKELVKLYKDAENQMKGINGNNADALMKFMRLLSDDMEKELSWQESVRQVGDKNKLLTSQARHVDNDGSRGYGAMWMKCCSYTQPLLMKDPEGFANAYLKYMPWDGDSMATSTLTHKQFFTKIKDNFDRINNARSRGVYIPGEDPIDNIKKMSESQNKETQDTNKGESKGILNSVAEGAWNGLKDAIKEKAGGE